MPQPDVDPKSLALVEYPDTVLRAKARPVERVDESVRAVAQAMLRIMQEEEGIGLAAPQVGLSWRLFVLDVPADQRRGSSPEAEPPSASRGPMVFINPALRFEGPVEPMEEGCLSLPDIRGDVVRPPVVTVTAIDEHGRPFTLRAGGLLARCIQHETDHLDGVLIIDRMTQGARLKNRKAIKELEQGA